MLGIGAGVQGQQSNENIYVSRIKFHVPITFPDYEQ
jgi:hypothetical protein